jgi:hypothetical protein
MGNETNWSLTARPRPLIRLTCAALSLAVLAICGTVLLVAQPSAPQPPIENLLLPQKHGLPVPANAPHIPEVLFDATNLGSPIKLNKGWRVGITADANAALPAFDDSTWQIRDAQESFADVPDEDHPEGGQHWDARTPHPPGHMRPYAWFRLHLKLTPGHDPLFLLLELPPSQTGTSGAETLGVDVFVNGKQIQPEGPHGDEPERYQQISRMYNLGLAPSDTSFTLALRTEYMPMGTAAYTSFFAHRKFHLGNREDLDRVLELWANHSLFGRIPRLVNSILLTVLAVFLLALYFTQKGHSEYLWLALYELLQAPTGLLELAGSTARMDHFLSGALVVQLLLISAYLYFEFLVCFLTLHTRWFIRLLRYTSPVLIGVGPMLFEMGHNTIPGRIMGISYLCIVTGILGWLIYSMHRVIWIRRRFISLGFLYLCALMVARIAFGLLFNNPVGPAPTALAVAVVWSAIWVAGWLFFIISTLVRATLRRNFEAGLLLIPLMLSLVAWIEYGVTAISDFAGQPYRSPLTLQAGPIPIHFDSVAEFAGIFVIVLIIFVRFLRIQRDQMRASSELAAARSVQELMIPQEQMRTPGFEVESIYNPANEVGGDFYHVESTEDGGLLVVLGDVAGKGLKAAMNVSMLMGALRRIPERSPAKILESLNRVLSGSESFTTCQAALFSADGGLVVANAGHLPPYLNSQEIAIEGELPLGVIAHINYAETRLYLHPGDRVLFLSDGVVEARRPSGELFGFERVHNLSNQSAFYIADAAKSWGQEDDITVLTVRRQ